MSIDIRSIDYTASDSSFEFERSLRETGFAIISNHPISKKLIDNVYDEWTLFFSSDKKNKYLFDAKNQDGFFPYKTENAKNAESKDLKEFFHFYPWGKLPKEIGESTFELYNQLIDLGKKLLYWIEENSPKKIQNLYNTPLKEMISGSKNHLFRIIHYPPVPKNADNNSIRASEHEDINLITLLVAGSEPGLQVLGTDNKWYDVKCNKDTIVVNCGDMLSVATNNYYPSTTHRVVNPSIGKNISRYSMPLFLHPKSDILLKDDLKAKDFLDNRLKEIGLK